jgi:hypothetical protein
MRRVVVTVDAVSADSDVVDFRRRFFFFSWSSSLSVTMVIFLSSSLPLDESLAPSN